jgi:hypothetical protein
MNEVLGSNLGSGTGCPEIFCGFPQSLEANARTVPQSGNRHTLNVMCLQFQFVGTIPKHLNLATFPKDLSALFTFSALHFGDETSTYTVNLSYIVSHYSAESDIPWL